ncbi:MAG TPA: PEP-CTERM sorting domain-containing protein [Azonexus sp.]|nr:PEP-CTERM sorting domain-containing protein [Azonexus sp.]
MLGSSPAELISNWTSSSGMPIHLGAKDMNMFSLPQRIAAVSLAFGACAAVAAPAPTTTDTFALRNQNSANSNNYATGDILLWGSNSVNPASTSYGFTRQCPAGSSCTTPNDTDWVKQALYYRPYTVYPDQFFASRPYDANLTNPWDLVLSSDPNYATGTNSVYSTQSVGSVGSMPFVQSMSVSGAGLTPTISWQLPTVLNNVAIDEVRVRVFDIGSPVTTTNRNGSSTQSFQQADFIYESNPITTGNSFQLPSSLNLQYGHQYSIAIALNDKRLDGSPESRSQSFFDFTPLNTGNINVFLPTFQPTPTTSGMTAGPLYGFNISGVSSSTVTYIDPLVATGFTFETGANDPNFWKVEVVSQIGDGFYDVYTWDGSGWTMVGTGLAAKTLFDFGTAGVSKFQIRGIETSAGLNPFDITAFVTGLLFVGDGNFTGTMQAIVADTSVPEPATFLMLVAGLLGIGIFRRKRVV